MIIPCPKCTTRLQLDDAKIPARPFTVRCPKCEFVINAQPQAAQGDGHAAGDDLPAPTHTQREPRGANATVHDLNPEAASAPAPAEVSADTSEAARLLAALLNLSQSANDAAAAESARPRPAWDKRRALVCVSTSHRREIAQALAREHYDVFVAEDTARAIENMREDKLDVLILDNEFDMMEQGAAFITREVNALRAADRRRAVVVHLSSSARTEDAHAAFLANVNLVVNPADVRDLPRSLERTTRDLNELYKDFNKALGVAGL